MKRYHVFQNFYPHVDELRTYFDEYFQRPYKLEKADYCWTYWYVPNQYIVLKADGKTFFPAPIFDKFQSFLHRWSLESFGLKPTLPTVALYVNGCGMMAHNDATNGRMAFIFSITRPRRTFTGGETIIYQDEFFDYWRKGGYLKDQAGMCDAVPPIFNQMLLFDDRVVHAVRDVRGSMDPLEGRVVVAGHLEAAAPFFQGEMSKEAALESIDAFENELGDVISEFREAGANGIIVPRLHIRPSGEISQVEFIFDNVINPDGTPVIPTLRERIEADLRKVKFPQLKDWVKFTIPLTLNQLPTD